MDGIYFLPAGGLDEYTICGDKGCADSKREHKPQTPKCGAIP